MIRSRLHYLAAVTLAVAAGLSARRFGGNLPPFVAEYAPDAIWAMMVYFLFAMLQPALPVWKIASAALLFAYSIELTQLYHAPWIDRIRSNRLWGLILGFGFLWTDLICYAAGISVAMVSDMLLRQWPTRTPLDTPK